MAAKLRELSLQKKEKGGELRFHKSKEKSGRKTVFVLGGKKRLRLRKSKEKLEEETRISSSARWGADFRVADFRKVLSWCLLKSEDRFNLVTKFIESLSCISEEEKTQLITKHRESKSEIRTILSMIEVMVGDPMISKNIEFPVDIKTGSEYPMGSKLLEPLVSRLKGNLRLFQAWSLILVRLPANDLLCYKLVCKLWRSVISSPGFMSAHLRLSKSNPTSHCLLIHEDNPRYDISPAVPLKSVVFCFCWSVAIVGSVNGLICMVGNSPYSNLLPGDGICIFNPVTGHIMKLPVPSESPFNHFTETAAFVFWCGDDDGEYKLAKIVSKPDNTIVASLWVSSSPETWSEIAVGFNASFYNPPSKVFGCDIVIGDIANWIVFKLIDGCDVGNLFVLSLHLKTLSISLNENPFPLHFMEPKNNVTFLPDNSFLFAANWKGNFALVEKDQHKSVYNVWTMDDGSWRIASSFAEEFRIERCINNINGESILTRVVGRDEDSLGMSLFGVETGEGELIEGYRWGKFVTSAHDFVGSFVSIKGFKPLEAYGLTQLPLLRILWPAPSASKTSSNCYLIPGYKPEHENESGNAT